MALSDEQSDQNSSRLFRLNNVFVGIRILANMGRPIADRFMIAAAPSPDSFRHPARYVAPELQPKWPGPEVRSPQG